MTEPTNISEVLARLLLDPMQESTPEAREEAANLAITMKQAEAHLKRLVKEEVIGPIIVARENETHEEMLHRVATNNERFRARQQLEEKL